MTLTAIVEPDWLSYSVTTPTGGTASRRLGLHRSCASAADPPCRAFPAAGADCAGTTTTTATATTAGGGGGPFTSCAAWRSTGFLMSFAAAVELAAVVGFLVIVAGGKRRRETGWRILGVLVAVVAALQFAATALVVRRLLAPPLDLTCLLACWEDAAEPAHCHDDPLLHRRTSSRTTASSPSRAGGSTRRGIFAPPAALWRPCAAWAWLSRPTHYRRKTDTSFCAIRRRGLRVVDGEKKKRRKK